MLGIAARSAGFVLAHVNIGASPDASSSWHLPRAVGVKRAMAMALLAEPVGAEAALAQARQLIHRSLGNTLAEQLALEARAMGLCATSPDFIEGLRAFLEKRKPVYDGG